MMLWDSANQYKSFPRYRVNIRKKTAGVLSLHSRKKLMSLIQLELDWHAGRRRLFYYFSLRWSLMYFLLVLYSLKMALNFGSSCLYHIYDLCGSGE